MKRLLIFPISLLVIAFSTVAVMSCSSEESGPEESGPGLTVNDCTWLVHDPICWNESALRGTPTFYCKLQDPSVGQVPQYYFCITYCGDKPEYLEDISVGYIFDFEDFQVTISMLIPDNKISFEEEPVWWATSGEVKVIGKTEDGNTFTLQFSNLVLRPTKSFFTDLTVNGIMEFKFNSQRNQSRV